ncbi:MAG TPA: MBL fold metallo-hydrolase [Stellaceae bacterium]|nr:MBL fold metallo-hydrolase [Stellaceae bacterium]
MTTVTIGAASLTRIEELYAADWDAPAFFPDWRPELVAKHLRWMVPDHFDPAKNCLKLSIHSWLIRIGGRTALVDTCVGNHKARPTRPKWHLMESRYLQRLAEAGVRPDEIDLVMCTHLHADHVGWNTRLDNGRWVPTFPKARYVFSKADYDHYLALDRAAKAPVNHGSFQDSVLPVVEAGQAQMVTGAEAIDEHLMLEPAPGHTPGSMVLKLASGGGALLCGDVLHHAIQVYHPEWNSFVCADAALARQSRRQVLEHCSGTGALLMPTHFGAPFVCHIEAKAGGFSPRFV